MKYVVLGLFYGTDLIATYDSVKEAWEAWTTSESTMYVVREGIQMDKKSWKNLRYVYNADVQEYFDKVFMYNNQGIYWGEIAPWS